MSTTDWTRHHTIGWVCTRCGYHARYHDSLLVHDRRAARGLGCIYSEN